MARASGRPDAAFRDLNQYSRVEELNSKVLQLQIDTVKRTSDDHELRLRALEDTATRFNFLLYLTMGGGLVGIFNLLGLAYLILAAAK